METAIKQEKRDVRLDVPRFQPSDFARTTYVATVEQGTTLEEVMEPAFWSYVQHQIRPYDKIEVRADDGSFYAELLVIGTARGAVKTALLIKTDLNTKIEAKGELYECKYKGPHKKWCVIRITDGLMVEEGIELKEEANAIAATLEKEAK